MNQWTMGSTITITNTTTTTTTGISETDINKETFLLSSNSDYE
jgi:hypothetical protein